MLLARIGALMISTERLTNVFVEVADTLVDDFDLVDFLQNLATHASDLSGAAAIGILLTDQRRRLQFMTASNESAAALELFQIQSEEGPCLDCFASGKPVVNLNLSNAMSIWPTFAPRALASGFQSVHAFPMRLRDRTLGALNIFDAEQVEFTSAEVRIVQSLADLATIALLQERARSRAEAVTEQLQGALNSRVIIEQAKGAVSKLAGVSVDDAFQLLRTRARTSGAHLVDVAQAVLSGVDESFR